MPHRVTVNGKAQTVDVDDHIPMRWVLRDVLGFTGTRFECGKGLCGTCTAHVDGPPVRACISPVRASAIAPALTNAIFGATETVIRKLPVRGQASVLRDESLVAVLAASVFMMRKCKKWPSRRVGVGALSLFVAFGLAACGTLPVQVHQPLSPALPQCSDSALVCIARESAPEPSLGGLILMPLGLYSLDTRNRADPTGSMLARRSVQRDG